MSLTTPKKAPIVSLKYSAESIRAALISLKGKEKGPATWQAVAPVFSALIASGGSKAELSASTAQAQVFRELHASTITAKGSEKFTVATPTGKAFRAACITALADFQANGRAVDQAQHDARLLSLSGAWCAFFVDAAPKAKDDSRETDKQVIARLTAENAALKIERDALAQALATARTTAPAQAPETAQA